MPNLPDTSKMPNLIEVELPIELRSKIEAILDMSCREDQKLMKISISDISGLIYFKSGDEYVATLMVSRYNALWCEYK